ncbi:hypothetical protein SAMN04487964_101245 [Marinobacterium sediminicola]|uniref:Uncharacterized protein n=2 Tax=Marinobacterium sediminicola TaxID=518898 RepID=A0ABY1RWA3_9GAMM|nr:hypothetical protein SAMN04487964_101245 [Marinobacterium sediminicola]
MMEPGWPVNKDWQKGQSRPENINARFYTAVLATSIFLLVMAAINLSQWGAVESALYRFMASDFTRFDPLLVLPFMLLVGLLGLPGTWREFVRWQRQRALVMTLDPLPAAPDGELGGRLIVPLSLPPDADINVTLNCMRRVVTKGKNASVRDELLWQTPAVIRQMRSIKGTRIEFCAPLSEQQPASSFEQGKRKHWWAIRVEVPEAGLTRPSRFRSVVRRARKRLITASLSGSDNRPRRLHRVLCVHGNRITWAMMARALPSRQVAAARPHGY